VVLTPDALTSVAYHSLSNVVCPIEGTDYFLLGTSPTKAHDFVTGELFTFTSNANPSVQGYYDSKLYVVDITLSGGGDTLTLNTWDFPGGTESQIATLSVSGSPANDVYYSGVIPDGSGNVYVVVINDTLDNVDVFEWDGSSISTVASDTSSYSFGTASQNLPRNQNSSIGQCFQLYLDGNDLVWYSTADSTFHRYVCDVSLGTLSRTVIASLPVSAASTIGSNTPGREITTYFMSSGDGTKVYDHITTTTWTLSETAGEAKVTPDSFLEINGRLFSIDWSSNTLGDVNFYIEYFADGTIDGPYAVNPETVSTGERLLENGWWFSKSIGLGYTHILTPFSMREIV